MDRNNTKVRVFFVKLLKILLIPVSRCRKCLRQCNTRQTNISIAVGAVILSIITVIYLYRLSIVIMEKKKEYTTPEYPDGTPMIHVPLNEIYKDFIKDDIDGRKDDVQREPVGMVNTPGCKIPIAMVDYEKSILNRTNNRPMCGRRAVYLRKYDNDKIIARIKSQIMNKYAKIYKNIHCCYRFVIDTLQYPYERPRVIFSNCTHFEDEAIITLQTDFVNVICSGYVTTINKSRIIYDDMYAFSKKINTTKPKPTNCKRHIRYNVLMLGMDSMSLPRAVKTLPRTIAFLKSDNWFGFRGYHKIADNNLPNLMALLTGKNMSTIINYCFRRMDECNDKIIWNDFKEAGYVTAYGEDYLELPDVFSKEYEFYDPPTDHYMRPFFVKGETRRQNNSILCAGKSSSGKQVLDYALDFANTYRKDSFFGLFWINSFSHDVASHTEDADKILENFLNQLTYTGILANTFVMFFSAHGLRFGNLRSKMESYYDDRMPMNFLWIPLLFKGKQPYELRALAINQFRLATPYDIYSTLVDINKISLCSNVTERAPEGCPNCHSMFEVISNNRTCQTAAIHDKWCSCHKLYPLPEQDPVGTESVYAAVNYIENKVSTIETQECWSCRTLSLKNVTRIHFYYDNDKVSMFYVVAFIMTPGDVSYEATVLRKGEDQNGYNITGPISLISQYRGFGRCALNRRDRIFCVCQRKDNC